MNRDSHFMCRTKKLWDGDRMLYGKMVSEKSQKQTEGSKTL